MAERRSGDQKQHRLKTQFWCCKTERPDLFLGFCEKRLFNTLLTEAQACLENIPFYDTEIVCLTCVAFDHQTPFRPPEKSFLEVPQCKRFWL